MRIVRILAALALVIAPAIPAHCEERVLVFAAASLKNALDDAVALFRETGGAPVVASYAASSALARQIENGAPADLFLSADLDWMDYLQQRHLIVEASRINLVGNRLVLIAPVDSPLVLRIAPGFPLAQALGDGRLAMADPASVPVGKYGKAALENLGVWSSVAMRVAPAPDVRAALLLVARAEAPLGIVYSTDAAAEKGVKTLDTFPESTHPPIRYPAALIAERHNPATVALLELLKSERVRPVFERYGFAFLP